MIISPFCRAGAAEMPFKRPAWRPEAELAAASSASGPAPKRPRIQTPQEAEAGKKFSSKILI
jgi:hypothetical protein